MRSLPGPIGVITAAAHAIDQLYHTCCQCNRSDVLQRLPTRYIYIYIYIYICMLLSLLEMGASCMNINGTIFIRRDKSLVATRDLVIPKDLHCQRDDNIVFLEMFNTRPLCLASPSCTADTPAREENDPKTACRRVGRAVEMSSLLIGLLSRTWATCPRSQSVVSTLPASPIDRHLLRPRLTVVG